MISKYVPFGLLEWLGLKLYEERFDSTVAYHFEIFDNFHLPNQDGSRDSVHVAFLETRVNKNNFNYHFGTFKEAPISPGIETQKQLDELRNKLLAIKKPENRIKARDLNDWLLGTLFENDYTKTIESYYINAWPTESTS
jgi:hypothetical protein